jgi:hypothetical protein
MAENRMKQEHETREKRTQKRAWVRPELLPSPTPREGYTYHWVRVSTNGDPDPTNVSSKLREGWEPVKATDHPEIELVSIENERFKDNIVMGGLLLCEAPVELVEQRNAYYRQHAQQQVESVDNNLMRENDPRMPLFTEKQSEVTFGKGKG